MHVRDTEPDNATILVKSRDTDVLILLTKYCSQIKRSVLFDTVFGNKWRLLSVNDIVHQKGEAICSKLPAFHCLTGCDTTSAFVLRGKISPLNLVEMNAEYISTLAMLGQGHECSSQLLTKIEKFV